MLIQHPIMTLGLLIIATTNITIADVAPPWQFCQIYHHHYYLSGPGG